MKDILFDPFLFALRVGLGVVIMYFMQIAKVADREVEMMERRKK